MSSRDAARISALVLACTAGCEARPTSDPGASEPAVVARVNGHPILEAELARTTSNHGDVAATREAMIDGLIQQELLAQQAEALGLDRDPGYRAGLAPLLAEVQSYRRRALSAAFVSRERERRMKVSEAEARAYYERNTARFTTELHLLQIMKRGKAAISEVEKALAAGESFETLFERSSPKLAEASRPLWDLGFLHWAQIPEEWVPVVYAMKPGEVSRIIEGPRERYWIVKLVAVRESPSGDFDSVKAKLIPVLEAEAAKNLTAVLDAELRKSAKIERVASTAASQPAR